MADNARPQPGSPGDARRNVVLIVVDQHHPELAGHAGHPDVLTPALDRLAAAGTRFSSAYSTNPVGSAARASIASGRYRVAAGDSAAGSRRPPGWGNSLAEAGYRVTTVGDLHVAATSESGFGDQRLSVRGDRAGVVRGTRVETARDHISFDIGPGESPYSRFDRAVTAAAVGFLREDARSEPWALMVSLAAPHVPRAVPREFFERYEDPGLDVPAADDHPAGWAEDDLKRGCDIGRSFTAAEHDRAYRATLALGSFLDARVGQLLDALEQSGQADETLVIYTAGHGGSCGLHGSWCRNALSDEAVGVPLLVAGPGVEPGLRVDAPVSHVDIAPTILDWAGVASRRAGGPGTSLFETARTAPADRAVAAGYAGEAGPSAMIRMGSLKYVEAVDRPPLLFDLATDPYEQSDLAGDPAQRSALAECAERLRALVEADGGAQGSRAALVG